jgi:trehalose 6-phosphate synthase/phosphatase
MNLVAKEYIASKQNSDGVLILSQTAGAAEELKDAILVNPRETGSLVNGLASAFLLPSKELKRRAKKMQKHLADTTVQVWAGSFMKSLQTPVKLPARSLNAALTRKLLTNYDGAKQRAIFLDYDGTLTETVLRPEDAVPSKTILKVLKKLAADPKNDVYVISGRSRKDLAGWLGSTNVGLVAEHGSFIKQSGKQRWQATNAADTSWKIKIKPILEKYAARTPAAHVEEKTTALVWHYRESPPYQAQKNVVVLKAALKPVLQRYGLKAYSGKKVIEVKHKDTQKGAVVKKFLSQKDYDFVLVAGDDYTDETMFRAIPPSGYSLKISLGATAAHYRVKSVANFVNLLEKLSS